MSYEDMKKHLYKHNDVLPIFPNVSVSSNEAIWYTDGHDQVNFYILTKQEFIQYSRNSKEKVQEIQHAQWKYPSVNTYPNSFFKIASMSFVSQKEFLLVDVSVSRDSFKEQKKDLDHIFNTIQQQN